MVMLAANQMNEQPLENTFVPQDHDLVHWSSYLKNALYPLLTDQCIPKSTNSPKGAYTSGFVQIHPDNIYS